MCGPRGVGMRTRRMGARAVVALGRAGQRALGACALRHKHEQHVQGARGAPASHVAWERCGRVC